MLPPKKTKEKRRTGTFSAESLAVVHVRKKANRMETKTSLRPLPRVADRLSDPSMARQADWIVGGGAGDGTAARDKAKVGT